LILLIGLVNCIVVNDGMVVVFVFFFQAEDGIRDFHVTGVQTCALPIFGTAIPQYCTAGATSLQYEKITNVTLNTINNNSTSTSEIGRASCRERDCHPVDPVNVKKAEN